MYRFLKYGLPFSRLTENLFSHVYFLHIPNLLCPCPKCVHFGFACFAFMAYHCTHSSSDPEEAVGDTRGFSLEGASHHGYPPPSSVRAPSFANLPPCPLQFIHSKIFLILSVSPAKPIKKPNLTASLDFSGHDEFVNSE